MLKYLGITVTNTNDIREEVKHKINMVNAYYYSLQKMLPSLLLSKKLNLIHIKLILPLYSMVAKLGVSP